MRCEARDGVVAAGRLGLWRTGARGISQAGAFAAGGALLRARAGLPGLPLDSDGDGLHDLDLYYRNILVREHEGTWLPVLHDFNLMPQHTFPPNPFLAIAYRAGIRRKSHRDYRCIRQWRQFSESCGNRETS